MPLYRTTRDTWISHKGLLAKAGDVVDLAPLPVVTVLGKDGKPEKVEMRIGDNFEPIEDEKPVKAKKGDTPLA